MLALLNGTISLRSHEVGKIKSGSVTYILGHPEHIGYYREEDTHVEANFNKGTVAALNLLYSDA